MEDLIVALIVCLAAVSVGVHLWRERTRAASRPPGCGGGCASCHCAQRPRDAQRGPPSTSAVLLVVALAAAAPGAALGADTLETWVPGAADVEVYLGVENLGTSRSEGVGSGELVLGYGVAEGLSAYLGVRLSGDGYLAQAEPQLSLGVFGTVLDTERVDLDLLLDVGTHGQGMSHLQVSPGVELNVDLPSVGLYLRAGTCLHGAEREQADGALHTAVALELVPGAWWSPGPGHQLLVEWILGLDATEGGSGPLDTGAVALGYNAVVSPTLELISQLSLMLPQSQRGWAVGAMVGFIATLEG